jgi:hypothetical protein
LAQHAVRLLQLRAITRVGTRLEQGPAWLFAQSAIARAFGVDLEAVERQIATDDMWTFDSRGGRTDRLRLR